MEHTDVARSERVRGDLATGYALHSSGLEPVPFREVPLPAAGGVYSTTSDLARYAVAVLNGGSGERGPVLKPETLASMFEPHHQPDPRVPGMGLGFLLGDEDGHRSVAHDGVVSGFPVGDSRTCSQERPSAPASRSGCAAATCCCSP